jgi:hypothetical protein
MLEMGMEMTLDQIAGAVPDMLTPQLLAEINKELAEHYEIRIFRRQSPRVRHHSPRYPLPWINYLGSRNISV